MMTWMLSHLITYSEPAGLMLEPKFSRWANRGQWAVNCGPSVCHVLNLPDTFSSFYSFHIHGFLNEIFQIVRPL